MKNFTEELIDKIDEELKLGLKQNLFRTSLAVGIEERSSANGQTKTGIDRENRIICGAAVATEGPAVGHGLDLDQKFLDQIVEAGNGLNHGVKARFDHPNASSTSIGKAIGRFRQFRKTGSVVRADLHLLKSAEKAPEGNYPEYLMDLAEEDPRSFGTSIVFSGKSEQRLEPDGTPKKGPDGKPLPRLARLEKLYAADVVDEPAANPNGMFHSLTQEKLAGKITAFLDRYFANKGINLGPSFDVPNLSTAEQHDAPKSVQSELDEFRKSVAGRMCNIYSCGRKLGVEKEKIEELAGSDLPLDQIIMSMIDDAEARDFFSQRALEYLIEKPAIPLAGGPSPREHGSQAGSATKTAGPAVPEGLSEEGQIEFWVQEFNASRALQDEFGSELTYLAFRINERRTRTAARREEGGEQ